MAATLTPLAMAPAVMAVEVDEADEPVLVPEEPADMVAVPWEPGAVAVALVVVLVGTRTGS